ncbi:MAG: YfhO family protein [Desulfuromonadales bacterium]
MSDRTRNLACVSGLLLVLVLFYSKILFTGKIIRAPDIINEFYWNIKGIGNVPFVDLLHIQLRAAWNIFINSGYSVEGGDASLSFLIWKQLIFWVIPAPACVAWFIVLHLFFGATGTFFCCRAIGASRPAAFLGGLIFALAPEIASLINAGHVMKIATISYAPWAFYFLERGFQSRRLIFFLTSAVVLAFQFFNTHWQIAFYTCLCVGAYGLFRLYGIMRSPDSNKNETIRLLSLNAALLVFFLTAVSISLVPLANWSKETNRGVQSGANQESTGVKGGLNVDEAMSWSFPPEELATFIVPGFFGLSRQEAGENPKNIKSYYWGRMNFTQTTDYIGLLPWLLLPLPLIFRRDRYTWLSLGGIIGGILFSFGKYTPFYIMLYKYFPGINHFRVPKMMMFIPVIALAILAARGLDLLMDGELRRTKAFGNYIKVICALPLFLLATLGLEAAGTKQWLELFFQNLVQPTRYEQGVQLVAQRWENILTETGVAAGIAALYAGALLLLLRQNLARYVPWLLLLLFAGDTCRVNSKFTFLVPAPHQAKGTAPAAPEIRFLSGMPVIFRVLPMDGNDPMQYATRNLPVMFTSNAVQQVRWQQFLDGFNLAGPMTDMLNVKYLVIKNADYQQQKEQMGQKYQTVFTAPDNGVVVLENRTVLPKGWLVPSAAVIPDPAQRLALLQIPQFNPATVALVESPPPIPLADPNSALTPLPAQNVTIPVYEGERIVVEAVVQVNALLVLGEKYYKGWKGTVDGKNVDIVPVNHILRGVYLTPGKHTVEFVFDPLPFKIGKFLTLASFALFAGMLVREWLVRRKKVEG